MNLDTHELEQIRRWITARNAEERAERKRREWSSYRASWRTIAYALLLLGSTVAVGAAAGIGVPYAIRKFLP